MSWKSVVPAVVATVLVGGGVAMAAENVPTEPAPITTEEITPSPEITPTQEEGSENESEGTESPEPKTESESESESEQAKAESEVVAPECPEGVRNHGEYVSGVAKSEERRALSGAERGALMAAAAQDDCGKPAKDDAEASESEEEKSADESEDDDKADEGPKPDKQKPAKANKGKGAGKSGRS